MNTGNVYMGFFPKEIIGQEALDTYLHRSLGLQLSSLISSVVGESVIDPSGAGLQIVTTDPGDAIGDRRMTIGGDLDALSDSGDVLESCGNTSTPVTYENTGNVTIDIHSDTWFENLPYANVDGSTYFVFMGRTQFPVDVGVARDGSRGYSRWVGAVGSSVTPTTVTDTGTGLKFAIAAWEGDGWRVSDWETTNTEDPDWSYDCVVYVDTSDANNLIESDDPNTAIAFAAKLWKPASGGGWEVVITSYLGQSVPSLTGSHYKIAILGPIITEDFPSDNPDLVYVGSVASATAEETSSTSGQIIIISLSDLVYSFNTMVGSLFIEGWFTRPNIDQDVGGTYWQVTDNGQLLANGVYLQSEAMGATTPPLGASQTEYIYYDTGSQTWAATTSYAVATTLPNVVLASYETNSSSHIKANTKQYIGKTWLQHTNAIKVTVGRAENSPMFNTLHQALYFFAALKSAVGDGQKLPPFEIEIVGDVEQQVSLNIASIFDLENVTIWSAVSSKVSVDGAGTVGNTGGRISWSFNASSLFELPANSIMKNWKFKGVLFRYTGTSSNGTRAVVGASASNTAIHGLTFEECVFDCSTAYSGLGGGSGQLAHVIYALSAASPTLRDITFDQCYICCYDAVVYNAGTNGTINLKMRDNVVVGLGGSASTIGTQGGLVVDVVGSVSTTASNWIITGNQVTNANGPCVSSPFINRAFIHDNYFNTDGDSSVLVLGRNASPQTCKNVMIHDNVLAQTGQTTPSPIITIDVVDSATEVYSGIILHDNIIDGSTVVTGSIGIRDSQSSTGTRTGHLMHDNIIVNVASGITGQDISDSIIHSNIIGGAGTLVGIALTAVTDRLMVTGNLVKATTTGISVLDGDFSVIGLNSIEVLGTAPTALAIGDAEGAIIVGNSLFLNGATGGAKTFTNGSNSPHNIMVGNLHHGENATGTNTLELNGDSSILVGELLRTIKMDQTSDSVSEMTYVGVSASITSNVDCWSGADSDAMMVGCRLGGRMVAKDEYLIVGCALNGSTTSLTHDTTGDLSLIGSKVAAAVVNSTDNISVIGSRITGALTHTGTGVLELTASEVIGNVSSTNGLISVIGSKLEGSLTQSTDSSSLSVIGSKIGTSLSNSNTGTTAVIIGSVIGTTTTLSSNSGAAKFIGVSAGGTITHNSTSKFTGLGLDATSFTNASSSGETVVIGSTMSGTLTQASGAGELTAVGLNLAVWSNSASNTTASTFVGCRIPTNMTNGSNNSGAKWMLVGTTVDGTLTIDHADALVVGCQMNQWVDGTLVDSLVFTGNRVRAGSATTIDSDNAVIAGCKFDSTVTLTMSDSAFVGNKTTGAVTDSTSSSTVASNEP